ncbi:hypothetical protein [Amycolatopsis australiensis]|uniref:Uncharacterized protein n=1 Tax=Amycolatopsis australiensis TaxID=546364 RepID=A0A1K1LL85_9PSEU|nr:hypothetical protein [Amycolatopsis australiensis]SFW11611.1 hypothetical protein SAMN04489730_0039 [Amycolatopsis australiensis]
MPSKHANPQQLNVRPPAEDLAAAKRILSGRSREIRGFVIACLRALRADPDGFLGQLDQYWPPPGAATTSRRRPADQPVDTSGTSPATSSADDA